jgi:hypothetical protein
MAGNELAIELLVLSEWTARQAAPAGRSPLAGDWSGRAPGVRHRPLLHRIGDTLAAAGEHLRGRAGEPGRARV